MENDLFLEMLEVYINSILYLREVYPAAIFRKRRIYSTTAYISIYPELNDYLLHTLKKAQELKAADKLFEVELIIYHREFVLFGTPDDEDILERYVFRVEKTDAKRPYLDMYILEFEEELRRGLIQLDQTAKNLKPLNSEHIGFRIHLQTTESALVDMVAKDNKRTQSFAWIQTMESRTEKSTNLLLKPVVQAMPFSLLLFTENKDHAKA